MAAVYGRQYGPSIAVLVVNREDVPGKVGRSSRGSQHYAPESTRPPPGSSIDNPFVSVAGEIITPGPAKKSRLRKHTLPGHCWTKGAVAIPAGSSKRHSTQLKQVSIRSLPNGCYFGFTPSALYAWSTRLSYRAISLGVRGGAEILFCPRPRSALRSLASLTAGNS